MREKREAPVVQAGAGKLAHGVGGQARRQNSTTSASLFDRLRDVLAPVRDVRPHEFYARCPVHDDRSPSLHVTATPEGATLVHCFGCQAGYFEILDALGIDAPGGPLPTSSSCRPRVPARDILPMLEEDLLLAAILLERSRDRIEADHREDFHGVVQRVRYVAENWREWGAGR